MERVKGNKLWSLFSPDTCPDLEKVWGDEMAKIFEPLSSDSFKIVNISSKKDVWPEFAKLFGGKYELK